MADQNVKIYLIEMKISIWGLSSFVLADYEFSI